MKRLFIIAPLALLFVACNNNVVSRAEYDAVEAHAKSLEALNDSLQFELSCLKVYVECLEEDKAELVEELKQNLCD